MSKHIFLWHGLQSGTDDAWQSQVILRIPARDSLEKMIYNQ